MNVIEFETDELWEIAYGDHEFAQVIKKDTYREGWYEYHEITFVYDGVQYSFVYKEHTSPKVCDREIVQDAKPTEAQPISVNPDEEAEFIWENLMKMDKGYISKEDIKTITELQTEYLISIGVIK
jgi:hypothetical protein